MVTANRIGPVSLTITCLEMITANQTGLLTVIKAYMEMRIMAVRTGPVSLINTSLETIEMATITPWKPEIT